MNGYYLTITGGDQRTISSNAFGNHPLLSYGFILCMRPANERRRYLVTSFLIGWVHTQNYRAMDSCQPHLASIYHFPSVCLSLYRHSLFHSSSSFAHRPRHGPWKSLSSGYYRKASYQDSLCLTIVMLSCYINVCVSQTAKVPMNMSYSWTPSLTPSDQHFIGT